jgi:hypothetical protein
MTDLVELLAQLKTDRDGHDLAADQHRRSAELLTAEIRGIEKAIAALEAVHVNEPGKLLHDWDNMFSLDRRCHVCGHADHGQTTAASPPCPGPRHAERKPRRDIPALVKECMQNHPDLAYSAELLSKKIGCRRTQVENALRALNGEQLAQVGGGEI